MTQHVRHQVAGGPDLKTVMERTGHSQIVATQEYVHTLPDADDEPLAAFEARRRSS